MQLACPKCGTREIRVSRRKGFVETIKGAGGVYPLRCRRCRHRWLTSVWAEGGWKYARCPRCYRQDLTTWSEQYYHPPRWVVFLLRMGATPYRCTTCRCNFASFKPCKEKFSWRHETKPAKPAASSLVKPGPPVSHANGSDAPRAARIADHAPAPVRRTAAEILEPEDQPKDEESPEPFL